jgi:hypothetical protein
MNIDELFEEPQLCPECGGISFSDLILAEKKDACYHKVKASAKVWPSAYASGRLVQCRKKGAANYGNKSEGVAEAGFPGAPDVEMPPMNPSGDPQRDKLKQEYMDLHREIKSLVDLQYRSTSDEQKMQAKARIEQLNDRADQIKAILEPRQPPNEWQKKTYGFDDNWNKVKQGMAETRRGQIPMTLKPGETDNLEPEDFAGFKKLPAYQQGQAAQQKAGKQLIQKSPYTFQSDQDWAYRQGATDAQRAAMFANFGGTKPLTTAEGEQQPGADYRDPKEVDYDAIDHDKSVARLKHLAGLGPMKTVYDPNKRVYRNMPTAQQPKK